MARPRGSPSRARIAGTPTKINAVEPPTHTVAASRWTATRTSSTNGRLDRDGLQGTPPRHEGAGDEERRPDGESADAPADDAEVGERRLEAHVEHDQVEQTELDSPGKREAVDVRLRLRVPAGEHRLPRTRTLGAEERHRRPERDRVQRERDDHPLVAEAPDVDDHADA